MPDTQELVLRCEWEAYMECGTGSTKKLNLIGEGFTTFPESKNPKEYSRKYIHQKTDTTDVIGYAPSIAYSCDCITNEPVVAEIIAIHEGELLGTDARRDIVSVNRWQKDTNGKCSAYKRTFAIIPDKKGDGTDSLTYTGTMKAVGDKIEGTFDPATKTFEPKAKA